MYVTFSYGMVWYGMDDDDDDDENTTINNGGWDDDDDETKVDINY